MIHYILTFAMGIAVGALLLIRSYEKAKPRKVRLRCPEELDSEESASQEVSTAGDADQPIFTAQSENSEPAANPDLQLESQQADNMQPDVAASPAAEDYTLQEPTLTVPAASGQSSTTAGDVSEPEAEIEPHVQLDNTPYIHSSEVNSFCEEADSESQEDTIHSVVDSAPTTRAVGGLIAAARKVLTPEQQQAFIQPAPTRHKIKADPAPTAPDCSAVTVYLQAPAQRPFQGYELLQALLSMSLRFGKRKIFHRYQNMHANKKIMYSVALSYAPGTFELERMGGQRYRGLAFIMARELGEYNIIAFEQMLQAAKSLQESLGGELLDATRQELSGDVLSQWRQRLREVSSEDDIMPVSTKDINSQDKHEVSE